VLFPSILREKGPLFIILEEFSVRKRSGFAEGFTRVRDVGPAFALGVEKYNSSEEPPVASP
jgi:hypothetical protein